MTKNLFLLFSLYFFVVQAIIVGILTGNSLFYTLGAINAGAILLISLLYFLFTPQEAQESDTKSEQKKLIKQPEKVEKEPLKEKEAPIVSEKVTEKEASIPKMVQAIPTTSQKKRRKSGTASQWIIFLITLIISIAIHFIISEFFTYRSILLSLVIGYVLFIIIGKVCSLNGFEKARKLASTRVYLLLIVLAGAYAGAYVAKQGELVEKYLPELWEISLFYTPEDIDTYQNEHPNDIEIQPALSSSGEYIYDGTGELLSDSRETDLSSGTTALSGTTETETGTLVSTVSSGNDVKVEEISTEVVSTGAIKDVTMIDAIKHVIDVNSIPLSTKTDIAFTSVSKTNSNYPYFKTAYEKRMIGKNTDPSKQISCETYMVIKGLGEGRAVGNYTDVKAAYWQQAEKLGKLNGCTKGGWVTTATW